jgi:hypothetical protein
MSAEKASAAASEAAAEQEERTKLLAMERLAAAVEKFTATAVKTAVVIAQMNACFFRIGGEIFGFNEAYCRVVSVIKGLEK